MTLSIFFRECEKYSSISENTDENDNSDAYSFDMVTNLGTRFRAQTYILPEKDKQRSAELEAKIAQVLSGDANVDICTLLSILNKKMKQ